MSKLALKLPGFGENLQIPSNAITPQFQADKFDTLPELISQIINLAFIAAGFVLFVFVFIGAFRYLAAGDNKENVAKARSRITWAIVGFLFLILAFAISQYTKSIFPVQNIENVPITTPQEINNPKNTNKQKITTPEQPQQEETVSDQAPQTNTPPTTTQPPQKGATQSQKECSKYSVKDCQDNKIPGCFITKCKSGYKCISESLPFTE